MAIFGQGLDQLLLQALALALLDLDRVVKLLLDLLLFELHRKQGRETESKIQMRPKAAYNILTLYPILL